MFIIASGKIGDMYWRNKMDYDKYDRIYNTNTPNESIVTAAAANPADAQTTCPDGSQRDTAGDCVTPPPSPPSPPPSHREVGS